MYWELLAMFQKLEELQDQHHLRYPYLILNLQKYLVLPEYL